MIARGACDLSEMGFSPETADRIYAVQPAVESAADMHGVPPQVVNAVIWVESRFHPDARSPVGARGLMQLMPATSEAMARRHELPDRPTDPYVGVHLGTLYLSLLLRRWKGDLDLALASYYAGAGRVAEAGGVVPPVAASYVSKVRQALTRFSAVHARCRGEPVPLPPGGGVVPVGPSRPSRPSRPSPVERPAAVASGGGGLGLLVLAGILLASQGGLRWL